MSPDLHHLTGAYAVDALDAEERAAFERHLPGCAACRDEVAELRAAAQTLGALTEATPPVGLRAAVLGGVSTVRPLPPRDEADSVLPLRRRRRARAASWLAAAAAVVLLVAGGLAWSPWSREEPARTALEQVERATDAATVTSRSGEVTATLAYSHELDRSAIAVSGLPSAPEGKTYQLWYIGADESARGAGFLVPADDGEGESVLRGSLRGAKAVGVTLEPAGGSPEPTTDPLMVMSLT
ncbi:anti-sigma factor [Phycicoccus endophyticus]|uniref:Regulator of SigK n=1 Tax=Phycicoccus endophyticus TaxID=1690220 RepID=A0A7G9R061_9MICO|nr:anti-sigma factor [Phycicoccus endophyticus]NHI20222.1 anti-sigma factor [Phycicoccus endophyticus]QNN48986.1 anti-sigma factor [Phycicoccus endophyticus]GGL44278.1 hypothetical protein GCM10012283_28620 [Phycicoccus endophyticus]